MPRTINGPHKWPVAALAALICLAVFSQPSHAQVTPGSTFSVSVVGYDSNNNGAYIVAATGVPFGTTQTPPASNYNTLGGQTLTVTSSESISAGVITDTFTISVPSNFSPGPIAKLAVDFGGYQLAGLGAQPFQFQNPVTSPTVKIFATLTGAGSTISLADYAAFGSGVAYNQSNGDLSLTALGILDLSGAGVTDLSPYAVNNFTITVSYAPVPEPTSIALCGFAAVGGLGWWKKRRGPKAISPANATC